MQVFLRCINNDINPIRVITLQESWGSSVVDMKLFHIQDYTMLYDDSRLSKRGGLITYAHDSFAVDRFDKDEYHQNSAVFESMILKIHKKANAYKKYIIETIYRRPLNSIDELLLFNQEFALLLNKLQANPHKSYICGDFNIHANHLKINDSEHSIGVLRGAKGALPPPPPNWLKCSKLETNKVRCCEVEITDQKGVHVVS